MELKNRDYNYVSGADCRVKIHGCWMMLVFFGILYLSCDISSQRSGVYCCAFGFLLLSRVFDVWLSWFFYNGCQFKSFWKARSFNCRRRQFSQADVMHVLQMPCDDVYNQ